METVKSGESWKHRFAAIGNNSFLEPYYNFWEFASLQLFLLYSLFRLSLRNCFIMRGSVPHVTIPLLGIALGIWHLFRIQRPLFRTRAWKGNISPHPGTSTNLHVYKKGWQYHLHWTPYPSWARFSGSRANFIRARITSRPALDNSPVPGRKGFTCLGGFPGSGGRWMVTGGTEPRIRPG